MQEYWLYLETYSFLWIKKEDIVIYNSLSGQILTFKSSNHMLAIFEKLREPENMYCIKITDDDLKDEVFKSAVEQIRESFSGDIVDVNVVASKPLSLPPTLSFQQQRDRLDKDKLEANPISVSVSLGDNVLNKLSDLYIYINGDCSADCPDCDKKWKQLPYCKKSPGILSYKAIHELIKKVKHRTHIHIVGGNILKHPDIKKIIDLLEERTSKATYYLNYKNVVSGIPSVLDRENIKILIDSIDENSVEGIKKFIMKYAESAISYLFVVSSEKEYDFVVKIAEASPVVEKIEIKPLYNGRNLDFLEACVFTTQDDLSMQRLNRRQIFANQSININDFGKLTIDTDGQVYANTFSSPIGDISQDISQIIYKELTTGTDWVRVRDKEPCSNCIYQWLCPSPSNYELVIGKPNLCSLTAM